MKLGRAGWAVGIVLIVAAGAVGMGRSSSRSAALVPEPWDSLPRDVDIEVLNGSGVAGVARDGATLLRRALLDVVWFGDADSALAGKSRNVILVRRRDTTGVGRVRAVIGDADVVDAYDVSRVVDLSVVLGRDFVGRRP
ncbi:MAG: LytR C-terminal domain-containing protein [Gemmatimonadales bacterium]|nr:LytR C-terminal domain-containing protein [Gemmatimonadales bacterium]